MFYLFLSKYFYKWNIIEPLFLPKHFIVAFYIQANQYGWEKNVFRQSVVCLNIDVL